MAEVVVSGGCGDDDLVRCAVEAEVDHFEASARHFADEIAALAFATTIAVAGGPTLAVASDVVDVADRRITERIATGLVPQLDELGQPAIEVAALAVTTYDRPGSS